MPKKKTRTDSAPYESHTLRQTMQIALRLANTQTGAPKRCRNPLCRNGSCHLVIEEESGDAVCRGGLGGAAIDQAALMLLFLSRLAEKFLGTGDR